MIRKTDFSLWSMTTGLSLALLLISPEWSWAQASRRNTTPAVTGKALDQQADKVVGDYLSGLADLATKYEESGEREKATEMLRSILKVRPDAEIVKARIKTLEEAVFNDNVTTLDLDPSAGWVPTGVVVTKDKPIRIQADGTFRLTLSETLSPAGYPSVDLVRDIADNVPFGGLMAMVVKGETGNRRGPPSRDKDSPKPTGIGVQREFKPPESGMLYLKINLPEAAKATGKVKVKINGNIQSLR
ncbi:MAG TPA: hypothetical protein VNQ76_00140 [Planctomicrobium sp.]|nr:hypothetical protein [Planctomicrobium sp.]